ncbi:F-box only protein 4 isoform X2 [Stegostoma tigrinum]|uniref:F-box only protein 4 isoform X2 n=1 Tax=Stegostoma tigrinum TaxID=3053191 RepID=UPI00287055CC|nr:F-box only protein 4 isoform X2 [Stegostoma tigrinum]
MAGSGDWAHEWSRIESTIRGSFRQLRERYLRRPRARNEEQALSQGESEQGTGNTLNKLPVEIQMYIMGLLSPQDLCQLGCVSRYWNAMVHDPLLWCYFLLRDLPHWGSVDHLSLPDAALLNKSLTENTEHDYMTVKERESARLEENVAVNRLFVEQRGAEGKQGEAARAAYCIIPQVQNVCSVVNGFIYVTNAEGRRRHDREQEVLQIQAMIDPSLGARSRPLLVLCCTSQPGVQRIPCVYVAHQLQLGQLDRAWLAHDTDAFSLNGFLDSIEWILREVGTL